MKKILLLCFLLFTCDDLPLFNQGHEGVCISQAIYDETIDGSIYKIISTCTEGECLDASSSTYYTNITCQEYCADIYSYVSYENTLQQNTPPTIECGE